MSKRLALVSAACAGSALIAAGTAFGQYDTGFEVSDGITASPSGTVLTGQDGFYVPSGIDYWTMTYAGNAFGVNANPNGGDQFAVGQGQAGPNYSRGQRDITWPSPLATMEYDVACLYTGAPPGADNLGSMSIQPYPGSASAIHLFHWMDPNTADAWQAGYLAYNADGTAMSTAVNPGPEWANLQLNHWYHFETDINFTTNQIVKASITDLTTMVTTSAAVTGVYLEGGSAGGAPMPTGFRMFSGGGIAGNIVAFDNVEFHATSGGCPSDFTASQVGNCPSANKIMWSGAPANSTVRVIYTTGNGSGGTIPPNSPCPGTRVCIGLGGLTLHAQVLRSDANGAGSTPNFNAPCGLHVQLITQTSCKTSNAITL